MSSPVQKPVQEQKQPETGDMLRCETCGMAIQVIEVCKSEDCRDSLQCCGNVMKNITGLEVPSSQK